VGKDIAPGDEAIVFLQDALLPPDDRWSFMEKHKWRVRMARFKGVPSECLIVKGALGMEPGTDLSESLGVTKYEKPIPAGMQGDFVGAFPANIPKTDEPNFQSVPELVERMHGESWYATEKADGSSCTAYVDSDGLHVCSRNWELKEFTASGGKNVYWVAARKYGLDRLPHGLALQFEVVGPGIQGNPMGLTEIEARAFTLRDTREHRNLPWSDLVKQTETLYMPTARFVANGDQGMTDEELRKLAEVKYANGKHGEGIVIRAIDSSWSFKAINLLYKD
jgi:RNA ligase (TIGR02306 family)